MEVLIWSFGGGVEIGLWAFRFPCGIADDLTIILIISSNMEAGQIGDSCSLDTSTILGFLSMTDQYATLVHTLYFTLQLTHFFQKNLVSTALCNSTQHSSLGGFGLH